MTTKNLINLQRIQKIHRARAAAESSLRDKGKQSHVSPVHKEGCVSRCLSTQEQQLHLTDGPGGMAYPWSTISFPQCCCQAAYICSAPSMDHGLTLQYKPTDLSFITSLGSREVEHERS